MRPSAIRRALKPASEAVHRKPAKDLTEAAEKVSLYDKYKPFATPVHVEGIWRAPRFQTFTEEQFNKAYPESYKGMRIGLGRPGTFAGEHADPKFDEISPLVWTFIMFSPFTISYLYEKYHEMFPKEH